MSVDALLSREFGTIPALIRAHGASRPAQPALIQGERRLDFAALDALMDRVASALQRDGVGVGQVIAVCAASSIEYAALFLGAIRGGAVVAPLPPTASAESLRAMLADCGAALLFADRQAAAALAGSGDVAHILLPEPRAVAGPSGSLAPGARPPEAALQRTWGDWLAPLGIDPAPVELEPEGAFNIIYSSGTTGSPKGIVQPHRMRWAHVQRGHDSGYGPSSVTLLSTPLYSNTTLVSFLPAIALGGAVVVMAKFDAAAFLALVERERVTHAMLVPVQYQRILEVSDLDRYDLGSLRMKFCTSAPFSAALKARVLARLPGGLVEYYGMTEGGGTCALAAHEFPDKLHTVGRPGPEHDIRVIDEHGGELPRGAAGELVGHSPAAIMTGYHKRPRETAEASWYDRAGRRFIRTGDIGRFDQDGFLILLDRKKDMIISGGFNIYPSDLEAVLAGHPALLEAAVVGVPSARWGETPVAFVVPRPGQRVAAAEIRDWANERLGKTQRLSAVECVESLPRGPIGKVLKRTLREDYTRRAREP